MLPQDDPSGGCGRDYRCWRIQVVSRRRIRQLIHQVCAGWSLPVEANIMVSSTVEFGTMPVGVHLYVHQPVVISRGFDQAEQLLIRQMKRGASSR